MTEITAEGVGAVTLDFRVRARLTESPDGKDELRLILPHGSAFEQLLKTGAELTLRFRLAPEPKAKSPTDVVAALTTETDRVPKGAQ